MSSAAVRAGRAYVELGVNDKMSRALLNAQRRFQAFGDMVKLLGAGVSAAGVGVVGALTATTLSFAKAGSEIFDMSKRTGLAVEELGELGYAARQSGVSLEDVEAGLKKVQRVVTAAREGSKGAAESLAEIGLSVKDLAGLGPGELFALIGDRISKIEDPTRRAAMAMAMFSNAGKGGTDLLPMLEGGAKGLELLGDKARKLGVVMGSADAKAADELDDSLQDLKDTVGGLRSAVGAALAGEFTEVIKVAADVVSGVSSWTAANRGAVVTIAKLAGWVTVAGGAIIAAGTSISVLGMGLGGLATATATTLGFLSSIGGLLLGLVSPVGALVVGVGALSAAFVDWRGVWESVSGWMGDKFTWLKDLGVGMVQGIINALKSGDVKLAAEIMMAGLEVAWRTAAVKIVAIWAQVKADMKGIFNEIQTPIAKAGIEAASWFAPLEKFIDTSPWAAKLNKLGVGIASAIPGLLPIGFAIERMSLDPDAKEKMLKGVDTRHDAAAARILEEQEEAVKAAAHALAHARDALRHSLDMAKQLAETPPMMGLNEDGPEGRLLGDFARVIAGTEAITQLSSRSIFNPEAILSLQASSNPLMDKIEKNTKAGAQSLERIERAVEDGGSGWD